MWRSEAADDLLSTEERGLGRRRGAGGGGGAAVRGWEHLETDRITDRRAEPWVNFSPPLTLSFGGRGKKKKVSTSSVIYEHIFIFSSVFALILPRCQHVVWVETPI